MNPHLMNPAGRLWALLVFSGTRGEGDASVLSVWTDYLGISPGYSAELFSALAGIAALPGQIRQAVASGGVPAGDEEQLLAAVSSAEAALAVAARLDSPVRELRAGVSPETLSVLKHASVSLNTSAAPGTPLRVPAAESLTHATARLVDLAPVEAQGNPATQVVLREHGDRVQQALRLMAVAGPEAVRVALEGMVGRLALRRDAIAAIRASALLSEAVAAMLVTLPSFGGSVVTPATGQEWETLVALVEAD